MITTSNNAMLTDEYIQLSVEEKEILRNWISSNLSPIKSINYLHSSNQLRHLLRDDINVDFSPEEFIGGMIMEGYASDDPDAIDRYFNVSEKRFKAAWHRVHG